MIDIDPGTMMQGLTAWKTAVETVKGTIDLFRSLIPASGGNEEQKKVIEQALVTASSSVAIAEAELGKAFGYELCKCTLPPTPMLTVGYHHLKTAAGKNEGDPVYECPKCGYNTAGPYTYRRIAPPREKVL